jgi:hypothetical protein
MTSPGLALHNPRCDAAADGADRGEVGHDPDHQVEDEGVEDGHEVDAPAGNRGCRDPWLGTKLAYSVDSTLKS